MILLALKMVPWMVFPNLKQNANLCRRWNLRLELDNDVVKEKEVNKIKGNKNEESWKHTSMKEAIVRHAAETTKTCSLVNDPLSYHMTNLQSQTVYAQCPEAIQQKNLQQYRTRSRFIWTRQLLTEAPLILPASTTISAAMKLTIEIDIQPDEIGLATEMLQFLRLGTLYMQNCSLGDL